MRARAKYAVIHRHGEKYPVCRMCKFFGVSRSGYYAYTHNLNRPNPNQSIIDQIARQQKRCKNTYGYRRMHLWLDKNGCHRNPKTVLRLMKTNGLLSEIRRRRQWKQLGQQVHRYENLLNRVIAERKKQSRAFIFQVSCLYTFPECSDDILIVFFKLLNHIISNKWGIGSLFKKKEFICMGFHVSK